MFRVRRHFVLAMVLLCPLQALAQAVSIDSGARWEGDGSHIDFGCARIGNEGELRLGSGTLDGIGDMLNTGSLALGGGTLEVGGDWSSPGAFAAGNGTVKFADRCGRALATIDGSAAFATLEIASARGKLYRFGAGQMRSVSTALRLDGAPGSPLVLRSTQAGTQARLALAPGALQQVAWVDAADQSAPLQWIAHGAAAAFDSIDSGNNFRWFGAPGHVQQIPVGTPWVLLLLAALLAAIGTVRFHIR